LALGRFQAGQARLANEWQPVLLQWVVLSVGRPDLKLQMNFQYFTAFSNYQTNSNLQNMKMSLLGLKKYPNFAW
jgi:hypothetical protein